MGKERLLWCLQVCGLAKDDVLSLKKNAADYPISIAHFFTEGF